MTDAAFFSATPLVFAADLAPAWRILRTPPSQTRFRRSKRAELDPEPGPKTFSSHSQPANHGAFSLTKTRRAYSAIFKSP